MPKRIDTASRFIPASPSAVYAAFADPRAMERWLPPKDMTGAILHFDFREGGSYRMRLTYDNSDDVRGKTSENADDVEVRFTKLADAEEIGQAVAFESDDPHFSGVMRMTWTFAADKDGTLVTVRAEDVPRGIRKEDHVAAMDSTLENLESFLGGG